MTEENRGLRFMRDLIASTKPEDIKVRDRLMQPLSSIGIAGGLTPKAYNEILGGIGEGELKKREAELAKRNVAPAVKPFTAMSGLEKRNNAAKPEVVEIK